MRAKRAAPLVHAPSSGVLCADCRSKDQTDGSRIDLTAKLTQDFILPFCQSYLLANLRAFRLCRIQISCRAEGCV